MTVVLLKLINNLIQSYCFELKAYPTEKVFSGCGWEDEPLKIVGNKLISKNIYGNMKLYIQDIKLLDEKELKSQDFNTMDFLTGSALLSKYRNESVWEKVNYESALFLQIKNPRELESIQLRSAKG